MRTFSDIEFFTSQRNTYIDRALKEMDYLIDIIRKPTEQNLLNFEVSLVVLATLVRKCIELELIPKQSFNRKLNSIIHMHFFGVKGGEIFVSSDHDIKKKREKTKVDSELLIEISSTLKRLKTEKLVSND